MKKAQIQMFESTMVLLFFFVFVGIGLIFYFNAATDDLAVETSKYNTLDAIKIALLASNAPEFIYTAEEWKDPTSFDIQKLKAFEMVRMMGNDYEYEFFYFQYGFSTITVKEVYPLTGVPFQIVLYNRTKENWKSKQTFKMPVGLKDVVASKTKLGVLTVEVYA